MSDLFLIWSVDFIPYALASAVIVGVIIGALLTLLHVSVE